MLETRFKLGEVEGLNPVETFELIGRKRGFILKGNQIDIKRTSTILIDEFKNGKIGKITMDEISEE